MRVYLMRHGIAFEPDNVRFPDDSQRPLTPKGEKRTRAVGRGMRVLGIRPDRVLSSSLTRAVQTAEIVARELRISAECIESTPHLAPGGDHFALLREQLGSSEPDASILIVGHEPGLSELLSLLITGSVTGIDIPLKKASLCRVDCGGPPPGERGTLRCLLTPSQLRALTKSR